MSIKWRALCFLLTTLVAFELRWLHAAILHRNPNFTRSDNLIHIRTDYQGNSSHPLSCVEFSNLKQSDTWSFFTSSRRCCKGPEKYSTTEHVRAYTNYLLTNHVELQRIGIVNLYSRKAITLIIAIKTSREIHISSSLQYSVYILMFDGLELPTIAQKALNTRQCFRLFGIGIIRVTPNRCS